MRKIIAVCGSDASDPDLSEFALKVAEKVGYFIAERGGVLVCGGGGGVMEAACRGVKKAGGLSIGVLPEKKDYANSFLDVALTTYLGRARNYIIVRSSDVVIGIAGRWGTLNEVSLSLNVGKPTIIVKGTGGWSDILSSNSLQDFLRSFPTRPFIADSAKQAVDIAFKVIEQKEQQWRK